MNERTMYQGNWSCAECGAAINELPFQPRSNDGLKCNNCMKRGRPERATYEGNWTCKECGTSVTSLPFKPENSDSVTCRDCHMASRPQRHERNDRRERRGMVEGNWTCKDCGAPITELPFKPRDPESVSCRACFQK